MSELKTLKDLEIVGTYSNGKYYHSERHEVVEIKDLRQEAINDIKEIQRQMKNRENVTSVQVKIGDFFANSIDYEAREPEVLIRYIKWKFNITEEDLK